MVEDIPNIVPLWVKLPQLPLSCWNDDCLTAIDNGVGKYIDRENTKGSQFACPQNCFKLDLEKGIPVEIFIMMRGWKHCQTLDYEHLLQVLGLP